MNSVPLLLTATALFHLTIGRNLLLRKPVTQSSIHPEYDGPPLAVDGNADPDWHNGHCSSTITEPYPWISVDMGERYAVIWATVTNRLRFYTSLKDVVIGVTDVANDPTSHENPTTSQFTECGRINGVVGSAETVVVTCPEGGVIGRHLVVMIDRSSPIILTVCEITAEGYEYLHWTFQPQLGDYTTDLEGLNDVLNTTCVSFTNLGKDSPFVLQGNLSNMFKQLTAHVVVKDGENLFDISNCQRGSAMLMAHDGPAGDRICRPFCGVLNVCTLEKITNREGFVVYELVCECNTSQCPGMLFYRSVQDILEAEICDIYVYIY